MNESAECGAEFQRLPGTTPQRYLCTLVSGHEGDHYDSYGPLRWHPSGHLHSCRCDSCQHDAMTEQESQR